MTQTAVNISPLGASAAAAYVTATECPWASRLIPSSSGTPVNDAVMGVLKSPRSVTSIPARLPTVWRTWAKGAFRASTVNSPRLTNTSRKVEEFARDAPTAPAARPSASAKIAVALNAKRPVPIRLIPGSLNQSKARAL